MRKGGTYRFDSGFESVAFAFLAVGESPGHGLWFSAMLLCCGLRSLFICVNVCVCEALVFKF